MAEYASVIMFIRILLLLAGYPVAITLGGTALVAAGIGIFTGTFDAAFHYSLHQTACSALWAIRL